MALRVPIGLAMLLVGAGGYIALRGADPLLAHLKTATFPAFADYSLSVIPLFLLMGEFATRAGLSRALFRAANLWLGRARGGTAMAAVGACAGFGAICGSSLATAATMGRVALPEMRRFGYAPSLATGALAAGGTLGILIPPSIVLVLYALIAEQNIATLFVAALLPAGLAVLLHLAAIAVLVRLRPGEAPPAVESEAEDRWAALAGTWPAAGIFALVVGGLYAGWFTPTEAAAVGALATGALAWSRGHMGWRGLADCLTGTAVTTGMVFLILLGADLLNVFLALTGLPRDAAAWAEGSALPALAILIGMLAVYLLLGCIMDSLSMILVTVPIFLPVVLGLDFGLSPDETALWFGILALIVVEVGLITPPVGLNVFVIHGLARDVPLTAVYRGVLPFLAADLVRVALLLAFPAITLVLVRLLQ
ncbi:MAG: TRAP transporter large permease subunit [Alphaproteobacteria bacterium]|nr:TRAP transporter large permease subunit [Alphaproteobacteria bacterium]